MSTLGTTRAHHARLHYPETGSPRAEVILDGGAAPAEGARLVLTVGDLAVTMTVLRAGLDAPDRPRIVLVGGIGWETEIATPPSYQNDAGVRLVTILADLATRAGEPVELPADVIIGDRWSCPAARPGEPLRLRDALSALYEQGFAPPWRVDPDGVTRFGLRTGGAVTARATVLRRELGVGLRVIGLDSPAAFMPGGTVDGATIRKLVVTDTASNLTAEVWSDARLTLRSRIIRVVAEAFPALVYGYPRTYIVAGYHLDPGTGLPDGRLDLAPPPSASYLQPLPAAEQWTLGGAEVKPLVGSSVVVIFRDANPTRPVIVAYEKARATTPTKITANAGEIDLGAAAGAVPRHGDTVLITGSVGVGTVSGILTITSGTAQVPPAVSKVKA